MSERVGRPDDLDRAFAVWLRETRRHRGWTQEMLADASLIGRRTVIRWEKGETQPEPAQLAAVVDVLGADLMTAYAVLGWLPPAAEDDAPADLRNAAEREIWAAKSLTRDERLELIAYLRARAELKVQATITADAEVDRGKQTG